MGGPIVFYKFPRPQICPKQKWFLALFNRFFTKPKYFEKKKKNDPSETFYLNLPSLCLGGLGRGVLMRVVPGSGGGEKNGAALDLAFWGLFGRGWPTKTPGNPNLTGLG